MKINYFFTICLTALFSGVSFAQEENKYDEETTYQKTLTLGAPSSREYAIAQFGKLYKLDKGNSYQTIRTTSDVTGMSHERIQQYYKGIKVEFGTLITHSRDGKVVSVNGELYNASGLALVPVISSETGFQKAIAATGARKYLWEDAAQADLMEYSKPIGELVLFPIVKTGVVRLAYKFDVYATEPISREEVFVDAVSGAILFRNPIIKHAHGLISQRQIETYSKNLEEITVGRKSALVAGSADTRYYLNRSIETTFDATLNKYVLNDLTRGNGIVTYNCERTGSMPSTHFQDDDNNWTAAEYDNANKDNAALDAHWGAIKTFDFWKNIFNRNSFDDNNGQIRSYVHYSPSGAGWDNAQWTGSVMRYGDGSSFNALTSVDVIGHEIGHAICQYTANLAYQNQSGAMNEGFSDIWGVCIEQYALNGNLNAPQDTASPGTQAVWKIGEKLATNPLRSISYPLTRGNPDTYKGTYYSTTGDDGNCSPGPNNDNCGVHNNSGVFNHWFYILTAGKAGTNNAPVIQRDTYNVTGIGMAKSSQIAYYAERDYLTPNSTFMDARNATLSVANSLYCSSSPEVIAVTNAWMAVNVGAAYVGQTNDVVLKTITGSSSIACGTPYSASIVFENAGSAPISSVTVSYNINGGAATTSTWTGSLPNCSSVNYPISVSGLTRGTHLLNVTTTFAGDGNATNNTKSVLLTVNDNGTVGVVNTFNAATDALVSIDEYGKTNTVWERGTSAKTKLSNAVAGSQVYATKLSGNYPDNTTSYLISQCYNLANMANPSVSFDLGFDLEANWDILYFEYSIDGGSNWSVLGTSADPNWYNSSRMPDGNDCFNCIGKQWTGDYATAPSGSNGMNGNKRNYSHTLAQFGNGGATPASNIIFRFKFVSDEAANQEGAIIDNFVIQGTLSTNEINFETFNVWPNPSNGNVNIQLNTTDKVNVTLFDIRGRNVYNKVFNSSGAMFNQEINFNSLEKGIYLLNVESEGRKATKKLIIN
ncbi:M4 thermolysin family metalloprotease precursor [Flavobacterium limnosediminis JC2902]|uniref:M4 thermolysin family metalloprotease n=1 Tax=Flavobacterium limnosediminis JC2902 TaxID=1341181 RepID=V6SV72_9FLAO|nr:M4 family metallopeptidase [Flavobacterium limnosediminis]ESU28320.1 M4 thermolysin family metalloprotease precursor [Flavobacterium limnosediminis JC2902]